MDIQIEPFAADKHDAEQVAALIYEADPEFNDMIYGSRAVGMKVIRQLMGLDVNYFTPPYLQCASTDGTVIGILVGFEGSEQDALDRASGKGLANTLGMWTFFQRLPTLIRLSRITWQDIDDDGYLVNSLCVAATHRSQGIGAQILRPILTAYDKVYLDVNIRNERALAFYLRLGFEIEEERTMMYRGKKVGTRSLKRVR